MVPTQSVDNVQPIMAYRSSCPYHYPVYFVRLSLGCRSGYCVHANMGSTEVRAVGTHEGSRSRLIWTNGQHCSSGVV